MAEVAAAGLVLAVIPILISGLEHYGSALEPLEGFYRYGKELKALRRFLKCEETKFLNTCEKLLQSYVDGRTLRLMLAQPGGPLWKNPKIQEGLQGVLHNGYTSFFDAVGEFKRDLEELVGKLDVDLDGKV